MGGRETKRNPTDLDDPWGEVLNGFDDEAAIGLSHAEPIIAVAMGQLDRTPSVLNCTTPLGSVLCRNDLDLTGHHGAELVSLGGWITVTSEAHIAYSLKVVKWGVDRTDSPV